jgi:diguanylate cyclase (GGDEF)-like protein/PAS domain S-box-containing protein
MTTAATTHPDVMTRLNEVPFYDPHLPPHEGTEQTSRILLVESDPAQRINLRRILTQPGRQFDQCGSYTETLGRLTGSHYDLILLDYRLPDGNSLAILEWLQRQDRDEAVIMMSDDCAMDIAIRALRRGAADFLRKPCHEIELRRSVRDVLKKHTFERASRSLRERLIASERLHRDLARRSPDLVFSLDTEGCFKFVNPRVISTLGIPERELVGRPLSSLVEAGNAAELDALLRGQRADPTRDFNVELRLECQGGTTDGCDQGHITVEVRGSPITEQEAERVVYTGLYCVARDVSAHRRAEELVGFQTYHDQLTRLPNRTLFRDRLELAIAQAQRRCNCLAVMVADIDRFKLVNDGYGQADGDALLCQIAARFTAAVKSGDTVARLGGDEFALLLTDIGGAEEAQRSARTIMRALEEPFALSQGPFRVTLSIGIAIYPTDGDNAEMLTRHADIAMRQIKQAGKNGLRFFAPEYNSHHRQRIAMENDLRVALEHDQLELLYQPQVSLAENRIVGMEALLRWNHPGNGVISPATFIPVAEEIGLIGEISHWVVEQACAQLAAWRTAGHTHLKMSLNLAQHDFGREDIIELVMDCLHRFTLPPDRLELEITESMAMQDGRSVAGRVRALRSAGVGIAIDDFGTGYSALAYLQELPVNVLKIDRRFVRDLDGLVTNPIVAAIAGIAKGFGLTLIAEGVEHARQALNLQALGCDVMQGYYFAQPLSASEALRIIPLPLRPVTG